MDVRRYPLTPTLSPLRRGEGDGASRTLCDPYFLSHPRGTERGIHTASPFANQPARNIPEFLDVSRGSGMNAALLSVARATGFRARR